MLFARSDGKILSLTEKPEKYNSVLCPTAITPGGRESEIQLHTMKPKNNQRS
jgi:hypothetical protein